MSAETATRTGRLAFRGLCLRQDKIPGGLYVASEGQGQSAIYKVFALPFFGWLRNILPLADESIKKWEARQ